MTDTRRHAISLLSLAVLLFSGCKKAPPPPAPAPAGQIGVASWYGHPFDGRQTASGEIYNMEKLTAAHRTLAFGTVVHITNQVNGRDVQVRINDRGPFVANRLIDLSHAAAQQIDMPGIANVRLEIISAPRTRDLPSFAVQVGQFATRDEAASLADRLKGQFGEGALVFRPGDQTWRVLVGRLPSPEQGDALAQKLEQQAGSAFVVRLDEQP